MSKTDARGRGTGVYAYRCNQCRTTSPDVPTRANLRGERDDHRRRFHGGHIPDGEEILEEERVRFFDLPREQKIAAVVVALVLLGGVLFKLG
ncbi:hypothetical protein [[Kitasatospora] papulosa]|uniref:hypothetical protein n=1 Tax=[Kitasatospora] papulosa TaxID=1464011 RepID=UPI00367637CE